MTLILGIDPGLRVGWALSDGRTGTLDLRSEYAEDQGKAGALYARWLSDMITEEGVTHVANERPFGRHPATEFTVYLARRGHEVAWLHGVSRSELTPSQVKKVVTGDGRADKKAVMQAMADRGWQFDSNHAADAAGVVYATQLGNKSK